MTAVNPEFAVVGHPNKGKSSIVATLARSGEIAISQRSGTTEIAQSYDINAHQGSLKLIDTPGFQRPYKALQWLKSHTNNASERAKTVAQFVQDESCRQAFPDEVALLEPIVNGAAIIYVVDGSKPYGAEYEFEMEILRWTGRPSMALINPIENEEYIDQWHDALQQYFKSVKVFNAMTAAFDKQVELLRIFAYLDEQWHTQLIKISDGLLEKRKQQTMQCADILAQLLVDVCHHSVEQKTLSETQATSISERLRSQFESGIKQREEDAFTRVLQVYQHQHAALAIDKLHLPPDLFDTEQWYIWGLNKKQLMAASALAGAMGGATVDAVTAGTSFMMGALGGGLLGAGGALLASNKIASMKIKGMKVGGYTASYGPINNKNFPYVILGRFIFFHHQVCNLNHANRTGMKINASDFQLLIEKLKKEDRKELTQACARLAKQKEVKDLKVILSTLLDNYLKISRGQST